MVVCRHIQEKYCKTYTKRLKNIGIFAMLFLSMRSAHASSEYCNYASVLPCAHAAEETQDKTLIFCYGGKR
jgi:hypothetical protein